MKNKKWGVLYCTYGNKFPEGVEKSVKSIRKTNPNLEICWITETPDHQKKNIFDYVIESKSQKKTGAHKRPDNYLLSPFDITLQLDTDTLIRSDLSYGFEKADKFSIAICHAPAYNGGIYVPKQSKKSLTAISPDQVIYNGGVIFYKKDELFRKLIDKWNEYNSKCKSPRDQPGLSNAMEELGINPFVLSKAWNFRHYYTEGHGPIKIWHSSREFPLEGDSNGFFKIKE